MILADNQIHLTDGAVFVATSWCWLGLEGGIRAEGHFDGDDDGEITVTIPTPSIRFVVGVNKNGGPLKKEWRQ